MQKSYKAAHQAGRASPAAIATSTTPAALAKPAAIEHPHAAMAAVAAVASHLVATAALSPAAQPQPSAPVTANCRCCPVDQLAWRSWPRRRDNRLRRHLRLRQHPAGMPNLAMAASAAILGAHACSTQHNKLANGELPSLRCSDGLCGTIPPSTAGWRSRARCRAYLRSASGLTARRMRWVHCPTVHALILLSHRCIE